MCAIFGIANHSEAADLTRLALHSLQHRGQEGAGIVSVNGPQHHIIKGRGLVGDVFANEQIQLLKGDSAIGHTRYSTTGADTEANLQPFLMRANGHWLAIAHNGNLTNAHDLIKSLEKQGSIFQSTTDTEVIIHLMAKSGLPLVESLLRALQLVEGSYSLLLLNQDKLIAARDPYGFRPLVMGFIKGKPVFASETCAFDLIGADYSREVKPGEMIVVDLSDGSYEVKRIGKQPLSRCIFEHVYFSRPDSEVFGVQVYDVRKALGRRLAMERPVSDCLVVPVPDSGVPAAIGYAQEMGMPFEMGIVRSHYSQRTFIEPKQEIRDLGVKLKLSAIKCKGKQIVVIDDSLVRGTTSKKIVAMLREAGASKVHLRIAAPPTISPCIYGIDTPTKEELLASSHNIEEINKFVGSDTLGYLSEKGLIETVSEFAGNGWCMACWNGEYIIPLGKERLK